MTMTTLAPPRLEPTATAPRPAGRPPGSRWLARGLITAGLGMIPWIAVLVSTLPASTRVQHWSMAWAGLDAMEGLGLLATGLLLGRRDARYGLTAAATAALITADAWFDVTTSAPGAGKLTALVMAAAIEVPAIVTCTALALRSCARVAAP
jgi:hypothetical protein